MHGIFFDEAPHEYSADHVQYMQDANNAVRDAIGIQGEKTVSTKRHMVDMVGKRTLADELSDNPQPWSRS